MKFSHIVMIGVFSLAVSGWAESTYEIDPAHSSAQFSVRHLMISNVKGEFRKVTGTVVYNPNNISLSKVDATIDANSIASGDPKRDEHLKGADFFDTAKFPTLVFHSKHVSKKDGVVSVKGELTIHGVTREVVLAVDGPTADQKDSWGNARFGVTATTKINRKDFGLTWNQALETGGVMVGDEISITIYVEVIKQKPGASVAK